MIVFSDLHLREETEQTVFCEVFPGLLSALEQDKDNRLICLGDFWHLRYQVSVRLQNRVLAFFQQLKQRGTMVELLPGNHDQINVHGENALEIFATLPNVFVYSEPQWTQSGLWIPYRKNKEDVKKALELPNNFHAPLVAWMHHGVQGALMNNTTRDTKGVDPEVFEEWAVYCGHYHNRQTVGHVHYIGSPYQTRADETGPKGYAIVHNRTFAARYVDTSWGKQYYDLGLVDLNKLDFTTVHPGDEIRATIPQGIDVRGVVERLNERGVRCIATPQVVAQEQRLQVENANNFHDYVVAYVNQFKGNLDKDRLLATYKGFADTVGK